MPSHQGNYLAFTNSEYDKSDVKDSCRGYFCNEEDLLKCVKGNRYDYKYLTILDLDTRGFTEYVWNSRYIYMDRRKMEDGTWDHEKKWLVMYWFHQPSVWIEFSFKDGGCGFDTEEHQMMYEAGRWVHIDYDHSDEYEGRLNNE